MYLEKMERNPLGCISNISLIAGREQLLRWDTWQGRDSVILWYPQYHNSPHQTVQSLTWLTLKERVCQHELTVNCLCKSHHGSTVTLILVCLTDVHENLSRRAESNMRHERMLRPFRSYLWGFWRLPCFPIIIF